MEPVRTFNPMTEYEYRQAVVAERARKRRLVFGILWAVTITVLAILAWWS